MSKRKRARRKRPVFPLRWGSEYMSGSGVNKTHWGEYHSKKQFFSDDQVALRKRKEAAQVRRFRRLFGRSPELTPIDPKAGVGHNDPYLEARKRELELIKDVPVENNVCLINGKLIKLFLFYHLGGKHFFMEYDTMTKLYKQSRGYVNRDYAMAAFNQNSIRWIKTFSLPD